jgi:hypothetical protein
MGAWEGGFRVSPDNNFLQMKTSFENGNPLDHSPSGLILISGKEAA